MKFFIDTAKVEDIKAANDMGVICGVTTNPSLIAKEGSTGMDPESTSNVYKAQYPMSRQFTFGLEVSF